MSAAPDTAPAIATERSKPASRWRSRLGSPVAVSGLLAAALIVFLTLFGPLLWQHGADATNVDALSQGSSWAHPFGTDELGRDIFKRVLVATRLSMLITIGSTLIAMVLGVLVGSLQVLAGVRIRRLIVMGVNLAIAFPGILLALFFASIFGVGARNATFALGLAVAPSVARLTLTLVASVGNRDFVAAAQGLGVSRSRILLRHILPNVAPQLVINAALFASSLLIASSSLSFLALGVQAPAYDWGRLMSDGLQTIYVNPMAAIAPGIAVVLAGLALNLCGEATAEVLSGRKRVDRSHRTSRRPRQLRPARDQASNPGVLRVSRLTVRLFTGGTGWVTPVRGVDFDLGRGESVGLVGESGSGKSLTALAVARLLRANADVAADEVTFDGYDMLARESEQQRRDLGTSLSMVFQDPLTSLNPTMRVGRQLAEVAEVHQGLSRRAAARKAVESLRAVRIPHPEHRARQYPHEFSGGMRQRAMLGIGLMGDPELIIADEPTTALDVTVQRQVLELLNDLVGDTGSSLLLISHDLAVVSSLCDRVLVMYAGSIVEDITSRDLVKDARHPYTRALIGALPDMTTDREQPLVTIPGRPPDPGAVGTGCAFAPRCPFASDECRTAPLLRAVGPEHRLACWHPVAEPLDGVAPRTEESR